MNAITAGQLPSAEAYRARRIAVSILLAVVLAVIGSGVNAIAGLVDDQAAAGDPVHQVESTVERFVRPGDTMWSIARSLQPEGDVRRLVDTLIDLNGGAALLAGDTIVVPVR